MQVRGRYADSAEGAKDDVLVTWTEMTSKEASGSVVLRYDRS